MIGLSFQKNLEPTILELLPEMIWGIKATLSYYREPSNSLRHRPRHGAESKGCNAAGLQIHSTHPLFRGFLPEIAKVEFPALIEDLNG